MRPLGENQVAFLRAMIVKHGVGRGSHPGAWFPGSGWEWDGCARTINIARSLERRGLIAEMPPPKHASSPYFEITPSGTIAVAEVEAHAWNDTPPDVHEKRARASEAARRRREAQQREIRLRSRWGSHRHGKAREALQAIASGDLNDPAGYARMVLQDFRLSDEDAA